MAPKQWNQPPAMTIDPKKKYEVKIETVRGTIVIELAPQYAPKTVNNFVFLINAFDIDPGKPDNSILLYRVESMEPGVMMPELGRTQTDPRAVEVLREWIEKMR